METITIAQCRELRLLEKDGLDALQERGYALFDSDKRELERLVNLYEQMRDEGLIDKFLFADEIVYSARVTVKGYDESRLPRFVAKKTVQAIGSAVKTILKPLSLVVSLLRGAIGGVVLLAVAYLFAHPNVLESIVHVI